MRNLIFKFQFIVGLLLLVCLNVQADDDLITKQITVKLDEAGTLSSKIGDSKKYKITNIKIVGEIDSSDVSFLCDMAGYSDRSNTDGKLSIIDLSDAKIVKTRYYDGSYESENVLKQNAFAHCTSLTSITLPATVISIGDRAFSGCHNLSNITIPLTVSSIGNSAFAYCTNLVSISLPTTVISIGNSAFMGCSNLIKISLPATVSSMGYDVVLDCDRLEEIDYMIEDIALYINSPINLSRDNSSKVKSKYFIEGKEISGLEIPSSVTSIGNDAFRDCFSLTKISIPSSVTSIGYSAFRGCVGLVDISIPQSVSFIGSFAFAYSIGIKNIYVNWDTPANFGKNAFEGIDKEKCILYIPKGTYDNYWLTNWGDFNLVEYDVTGIDKVPTSEDVKELSRYAADGQRLDAPAKGLNIVKYSDGSVKKVVVQ